MRLKIIDTIFWTSFYQYNTNPLLFFSQIIFVLRRNQLFSKKTIICLIALKTFTLSAYAENRSSPPEVFLVKGVLKICSKFTGEYSCRSVISIKLQSNFIEITLQHGCSPVYLLHIFRILFPKNTSEWLLPRKWSDCFDRCF